MSVPFTAEQEARLREIVDEVVRDVMAGTAPVRAVGVRGALSYRKLCALPPEIIVPARRPRPDQGRARHAG